MIYFIGYSYKSNDDPFPKFGNRIVEMSQEDREYKELIDGSLWALEKWVNNLGDNTHSFEIISINKLD